MIDALVNTWAARAGMKSREQDDGSWVAMDLETAYRLSSDRDGFEVSERGRGGYQSLARLAGLDDAERVVLLLIGMPWRSGRGWGVPFPSGLGPGFGIVAERDGCRLTGNGGSDWFRSEVDAQRFSRVSALTLDALSGLLEAR